MDGSGEEIPEPYLNPFGTGSGFNSPSPLGFGRRMRIVWGFRFGFWVIKIVSDLPCCHAYWKPKGEVFRGHPFEF